MLLVVAAVVLAAGSVAVIAGRRKLPAMAATVLALVAVGVGGHAGSASAAAASCAGFPVCFNLPDPGPDQLIDSTDGVHLTATIFPSADGSCSGQGQLVLVGGVVAPNQQAAEDLCGTTVDNLYDTAVLMGVTPLPPTNWWSCD